MTSYEPKRHEYNSKFCVDFEFDLQFYLRVRNSVPWARNYGNLKCERTNSYEPKKHQCESEFCVYFEFDLQFHQRVRNYGLMDQHGGQTRNTRKILTQIDIFSAHRCSYARTSNFEIHIHGFRSFLLRVRNSVPLYNWGQIRNIRKILTDSDVFWAHSCSYARNSNSNGFP